MSTLPTLSYVTLGFMGTLLFAALQGALVWALAALVAHILGTKHWAAKLTLIALSWLAWVVGGMAMWSALGGGGGLFDGGLPVLAVIPTGIYGSAAAAAAALWLYFGARVRKSNV
ncbi:hypothetical protein OOT33_06070 [Sphingobium sp. DEHP117]|uniref:hypothetical protein n=1 Tax=Sphingobium sp. DEHP117 TaxID=2993436 RepID=UPI0027D5FA65|nr:hypothetical protein [Sphingobium sp. DEHP117]MDQ4420006.1 hypothetical protein [Sphingobium sp. DEHP117]